MEKFISKTNYANLHSDSLRCTIPKEIVKALNLEKGDSIKWTLDETGKVTVEKLDL
ncbi:MAG: AbrB/MazE/SpoVT family DNA-binding domain-containing protein [Methanobrevibacter sp.]|nr:AbrB/MazE/SpoVT family DNA-binding domain-containing protein [Methanobrevibacter sp.]MBQ9024917.1 AbrB/MazE/SpoVT family DNA-binding domain-containing protein [Methanobrevibacter sp.]